MKCNLRKNNFTTKEEYEEGVKIFFKFLKERNAFYVYLNNFCCLPFFYFGPLNLVNLHVFNFAEKTGKDDYTMLKI